jgi:[ribosomal protein S18]-alanine N-acetyltransferase
MSDDLDRIMAIMACAFDPAFGEAWSRRQLEDSLVLGSSHYGLINATGDEPAPGEAAAGFFLSRQGVEEEELLLLAVAPQYRCKGLATRLLIAFAAAARSRGALRLLLEMRQGNPAESLYRRQSFRPIGHRPNYYRTPAGERLDAITFARDVE